MRFTTKSAILLIIPIILEHLLGMTIGLFDGIMVASEGETAVSGVSLSNAIDNFLMVFFTSLSTGGAIVISQFFGKKDLEKSRESAKQLVYVSTFIAIIIGLLLGFFRAPILKLFYGSVEPAVMNSALVYLLLMALSHPFLSMSCAGHAILRAQGRTKVTLYNSLFSNAFNVCGNALFIYGLGWGVFGAGLSTLLARAVAGLLAFLLCVKKKENGVYIEKFFHYKPNGFLIKRICFIGIPSGLENSFFNLGRLLVASLVSTYGTASIAANAVSQTLANFHWMVGSAIGLGLSTIVGICVGAGLKDEAKLNVKKILIFNYCCYAVISVFFFFTVGLFSRLYNLSPEASVLCANIVRINCIACIIIWPLAFTIPHALRATNDVRFTMVVSICSMWIFRVAGSYLVSHFFHLGLYSIWVGMLADWVCRTIFYVIRYRRGAWLNKYKD